MTITLGPDDNMSTVQPDDGEPTFEQLAAELPDTAQGFLDAALPTVQSSSVEDAGMLDAGFPGSDPSSTPRKRINVSKKIRKAMNKFKDKVAQVPIMWFHTQARNQPEWELDKDEQELLTDAIGTVFEVLDIEFEIEPLSWTLTSVWWVISYPLLAFTFLFLTKKSLTMEKDKPDTEEQQP